MTQVQLYLLGPFNLKVAGTQVTRFRSQREAALNVVAGRLLGATYSCQAQISTLLRKILRQS